MYKVDYTPQSSYNTELYHHGVLGMKWGVRRYQDYGKGGYNPKGKHQSTGGIIQKTGNRKSKTLEEARSKDINELTDEELRKYNNRLQAEKQFLELTKTGEEKVLQYIANDGKQLVTNLANSKIMNIGKKIMNISNQPSKGLVEGKALEPRNENYSDAQRKQDEKFYGKKAVDRINKRMNDGENLLTARHQEVVRKDKIENGKKVVKRTLKGTIALTSAAVSLDMSLNGGKYTKQVINAVGKKVLKK